MEFSGNEELVGNSYNKMKEQLGVHHQLAVHGAEQAKESIEGDLSILEGTIGTEYLDEDMLLEQIRELEAECRGYEDTIEWLTALCRSSVIGLIGYFLVPLIEMNRRLLARTEEEIRKLKEKVELIYDIDDWTAGLFLSASDWYGAVYNAMNDLQVRITEVGTISGGSWMDLLRTSYENKVGTLTGIDRLLSEEGSEVLELSYTDKDGKTVTIKWDIMNEMFTDKDALTLEQITSICESKNPGLVERGFHEAIYELSQKKAINPIIVLATLGQEQRWCKKNTDDVYNKAFGVGPGGNPIDFAEGSMGGLGVAIDTYLKWYNEGLAYELAGAMPTIKVNYDPAPYKETAPVAKSKNMSLEEWQKQYPEYVKYMEEGMEIQPVSAAMYAKLKYTPWIDFPPEGSHPLEDWQSIIHSIEQGVE